MHCRIRITGIVHGKRQKEALSFVQFCNSILIVFNQWVFANLKKTMVDLLYRHSKVGEEILILEGTCFCRMLKYFSFTSYFKIFKFYWNYLRVRNNEEGINIILIDICIRDLPVVISTSLIAAIVSSCTDTPKLFPSSIFALASSINCLRLGLTISITSTIFLLDGMSVCPEIHNNIQYNYFLLHSNFMTFEATSNSGILSNSFKCNIRSGNF
ncbi:hypothetical protein AGLY_018017 [Aphis glycines]|uniref:Uncharacterized protein n=1 Tax=Aphis glycines TaxID=307491 RepID=A0A6G0SVA2_APHGL|nr:hypothetical protein AGLY_018017 [Aphis glycines]